MKSLQFYTNSAPAQRILKYLEDILEKTVGIIPCKATFYQSAILSGEWRVESTYLGKTRFITSLACGLLRFPEGKSILNFNEKHQKLSSFNSARTCLTSSLMSSSLNVVIDINCFCLASSSSFCFRFFSKARRALSLGSSKSSLITMDSTKCLGNGGFSFRILTNISLYSLPQMIWNFSCSTLFLIFSFVHGSWFISDVRV